MESLGQLLELKGLRANIAKCNWPDEFPYKPLVAVSLAYNEQGLYLHYVVHEASLRAMAAHDGCYVHEDSCVEFFMQPFEGPEYINFEFNAAGVCYAAHHASREESVPFTPEEYAEIKRYTPLMGQHLKEQNDELASWQLSVFIPWTTMGYAPEVVPNKLRANFYKCGDGHKRPHYLSWSPIDLPAPNFHCPDFFGQVKLQEPMA